MKITEQNMDQLAWKKQNDLIPAIVQDADSGILLMQAYMNPESLQRTLETKLLTFYSRSRQCLWTKGETSGNSLDCVEIIADCDGDSLKVLAHPAGPVCHKGTMSCWDDAQQPSLTFLMELEAIIGERKSSLPEESYTALLHQRGLKYVAQKVGEEAVETALAAVSGDQQEFLNESADLIYHLFVLINQKGLSLIDLIDVLKSRHQTA